VKHVLRIPPYPSPFSTLFLFSLSSSAANHSPSDGASAMSSPQPITSSDQSAQRVISELRELAALTSTPEGAQRLAWGFIWRTARKWLIGKLDAIGLKHEIDSAGNLFVTFCGASDKIVILASHVDSVPNGGWLDGVLGVVIALEAVRCYAAVSD